MLKREDVNYYFITSSTDNPVTNLSVVDTVKAALEGGARIIQYREKKLSLEEMLPIAKEIRRLTKDYHATFIINNYLKLAQDVDADGIHLGQKDTSYSHAREILGNHKLIGISVSNTQQALLAIKTGADYISFSPLYETKTKIDAPPPCGIETLKTIREILDSNGLPPIPLIAIGGIHKENYQNTIQAGADGICAISPVLTNSDYQEIIKNTREFITGVKQAKQ